METSALLKRITIDPEICHGKPCIRGLRYPSRADPELLESGMSSEDILADSQIRSMKIFWPHLRLLHGSARKRLETVLV